MNTITIDILNEKAINLLQELEALNLIKILKKETKQPLKEMTVKKKASDYKGIIPPEVGEKMQENVRQSREEWRNEPTNLVTKYKGSMSKQPLIEVDKQLNDLRIES